MRLKHVSIVLTAAIGMVMFAAAAAFACTDLAVVNFNRTSGPPGAIVRITASAFSTNVAGDPIVVHWGPTAQGAVLAQAPLDQSGNVDVTFTVPQVVPGYYLLSLGEKDSGRIVRSRFQVLGNSSAVKAPAVTPVLSGALSQPNSNGVVALAAGLGAFGFGLFGAGFVAFTRDARRRRRVPVAVAQRGD